jgi:hypothetical protein
MQSGGLALPEAALLLRRAGLEHLVTGFPSPEEVQALANAGDVLELERAAALARAIHDRGAALAPFDGGACVRAETKALAYALSRGN